MRRIWLIAAIALVILLGIIIFLKIKSARLDQGPKDKSVRRISSTSLLNTAKNLEAKGDLVGAKLAYQNLMNNFSSSPEIMNWQKKVEDLNIKLLFSLTITPGSILYQIKPGDNLTKIANAYKTTPELIKKSNHLSDDKIMPGRKIKVWDAPFSIMVDKSQNILLLKTNEEVLKTYIVATGMNNSTPVGTFKIVNKLLNPTWFKAGAVVSPNSPENILGSRWLGINVPGYGIHGTTEPQSLGRQVTQGCVRMANSDVEELYTIIPVDTEVDIVD